MPSEKTMRRVKDDLTERFAHQQKIGGVGTKPGEEHKALESNAVPDMQSIGEYLDPILHKVDVDEEADRHKSAPVDDVAKEDYSVTRKDKETGDNYDVSVAHKGVYDWDLKNDTFRAAPGSFLPSKKKESVESHAARHRIRFLKALPEWKAKFESAFWKAQGAKEKEQKLREILDSSNRLFGDWKKPRNTVVSVFGKLGLG